VAPEPGFSYVHPAFGRSQEALKGATRILCELKQQFDVVSARRSWDGYQLLILPDLVVLDEAAADKVRAHLDRGGAILASGWSGADPEKRQFVLEEWGLDLRGEEPCDPAYILVGAQLSQGMPDMPVVLYERGTAVSPLAGTRVLAEIGAPYYNRHWDGEHGFVYLPPDKGTGRAAVTLCGSVAYVSCPIFTSYYHHAPVPMRQIVANLLEKLLPRPLLRTEGLPSFARVTVTQQAKRRIVHLLSYVPERRGPTVDMIEEPVELRNVSVALRADDSRPTRVYLAPSRQQLPLGSAQGYSTTLIPVVPGYAMVVFELGE
jgi:hypothetical protein